MTGRGQRLAYKKTGVVTQVLVKFHIKQFIVHCWMKNYKYAGLKIRTKLCNANPI